MHFQECLNKTVKGECTYLDFLKIKTLKNSRNLYTVDFLQTKRRQVARSMSRAVALFVRLTVPSCFISPAYARYDG